MSARSRVVAAGLSAVLTFSAVLTLGAVGAPAAADQARSPDPDVTSMELSPADALRTAVRDARAQYATEVTAARAARRSALSGPRAELAAALDAARAKAQRRTARRTYATARAPIQADYRSATQSAGAKRDAAVNEALAEYLVATGKPEVAAALAGYHTATSTARATLELALKSGRDTFRTDTADERARLLSDLEQAVTEAESADAWLDFVAATSTQRMVLNRSVANARATYRSAIRKARAEFRALTGISTKRLSTLPFRV